MLFIGFLGEEVLAWLNVARERPDMPFLSIRHDREEALNSNNVLNLRQNSKKNPVMPENAQSLPHG